MARTLYELQLEAYGGPGHVPGSGGYRTYRVGDELEAYRREHAPKRPGRVLALSCYCGDCRECAAQAARDAQARVLWLRVNGVPA